MFSGNSLTQSCPRFTIYFVLTVLCVNSTLCYQVYNKLGISKTLLVIRNFHVNELPLYVYTMHKHTQVAKIYQDDPEADPVEMAEEVSRMREHVMREVNRYVPFTCG